MKNLFYYFIKYFVRFATRCYFRNTQVIGLENIPKDGGILLSPNHQGAFLDPLLVGSSIPQPVTSLTRSDVFGGPLQWFMDALNMLPVYRIRNGYSNLRKNDEIFVKCRDLLSSKQTIMMFSEASHHEEYYLQQLSKGSSRLAYEAQIESKFPVYIVPVGINYGHHFKPLCDLHLVFGKPILVKKFLKGSFPKPEAINNIREALSKAMKECIWLPDNDSDYLKRKNLIHRESTEMNFKDLKDGLALMNISPKKRYNNQKGLKFLLALVSLPNLPPLLIMKRILSLFEDVVFYSSVKMTAGLILFGLWWLILFLLVGIYLSWVAATMIALGAIMFLYIRQNLLFLINE